MSNVNFTVKGKYNEAVVYATQYQDCDIQQVKDMCDLPFLTDAANIKMMPDMHSGAGCTIGTTMRVKDAIVPNFVGVDINCGVLVAKIPGNQVDINLRQFDEVVRASVPIGKTIFDYNDFSGMYGSSLAWLFGDASGGNFISQLRRRWPEMTTEYEDYITRSAGTLGGGNHFIAIEQSQITGQNYLLIHSGSRNLGHLVAKKYQEAAYESGISEERNQIIADLKAQGRHREIQKAIEEFNDKAKPVSKETAYVAGQLMRDYLHDLQIVGNFATYNRMTMFVNIFAGMGWHPHDFFETVHNYIDMSPPDGGLPILRKGAVSAKKGEKFVIPLNMVDGSVICEGLGNPHWNFSAPHGAGRVMSRRKAFETLDTDTLASQINNAQVYTTSNLKEVLDEAPGAYKSAEDIIELIEGTTATVIDRILPIYNLKAGKED